jgi:hypothetical protein
MEFGAPFSAPLPPRIASRSTAVIVPPQQKSDFIRQHEDRLRAESAKPAPAPERRPRVSVPLPMETVCTASMDNVFASKAIRTSLHAIRSADRRRVLLPGESGQAFQSAARFRYVLDPVMKNVVRFRIISVEMPAPDVPPRASARTVHATLPGGAVTRSFKAPADLSSLSAVSEDVWLRSDPNGNIRSFQLVPLMLDPLRFVSSSLVQFHIPICASDRTVQQNDTVALARLDSGLISDGLYRVESVSSTFSGTAVTIRVPPREPITYSPFGGPSVALGVPLPVQIKFPVVSGGFPAGPSTEPVVSAPRPDPILPWVQRSAASNTVEAVSLGTSASGFYHAGQRVMIRNGEIEMWPYRVASFDQADGTLRFSRDASAVPRSAAPVVALASRSLRRAGPLVGFEAACSTRELANKGPVSVRGQPQFSLLDTVHVEPHPSGDPQLCLAWLGHLPPALCDRTSVRRASDGSLEVRAASGAALANWQDEDGPQLSADTALTFPHSLAAPQKTSRAYGQRMALQAPVTEVVALPPLDGPLSARPIRVVGAVWDPDAGLVRFSADRATAGDLQLVAARLARPLDPDGPDADALAGPSRYRTFLRIGARVQLLLSPFLDAEPDLLVDIVESDPREGGLAAFRPPANRDGAQIAKTAAFFVPRSLELELPLHGLNEVVAMKPHPGDSRVLLVHTALDHPWQTGRAVSVTTDGVSLSGRVWAARSPRYAWLQMDDADCISSLVYGGVLGSPLVSLSGIQGSVGTFPAEALQRGHLAGVIDRNRIVVDFDDALEPSVPPQIVAIEGAGGPMLRIASASHGFLSVYAPDPVLARASAVPRYSFLFLCCTIPGYVGAQQMGIVNSAGVQNVIAKILLPAQRVVLFNTFVAGDLLLLPVVGSYVAELEFSLRWPDGTLLSAQDTEDWSITLQIDELQDVLESESVVDSMPRGPLDRT